MAMINSKDSKDSTTKLVDETKELFNTYSQNREIWAKHAKEDKEFRLGRQWTQEQEETLKSRGQALVTVNRIHPAVESAKAMLTSRRPSFRVAPREDSDNKVAQVVSALLSYMIDVSDGISVIRAAIDDYYVMGMGLIQVYQDPTKDMGKGEVCIRDLDPLDVYIDPNSRSRYFDDAESVIVSRMFTKGQATKMYPMYEKAIKNASSDQNWNQVNTGSATDDYSAQFPEDVGQVRNQDYIRGYERYFKVKVPKYRVFESFSGKEHLLDKEEFVQYMQQPAWILQGQKILTDPQQVQQLIQQFKMQTSQQMQELGYDQSAEMPDIPIEEVTYAQLVEMGKIEIVEIEVTRIKMCVIMGDTYLYGRILPTEDYPIIPLMNIHTRTPYPTSDVRMVKGIQQYINKTRSLIIAHATTSTNTKILVPEGSVDMAEFEQKWAQPGVAIPYDPTDGAPMPVQPTPLPNELYNNEQTAKNDIDHQLGLYEMMMGNSQVAPQTYKATISLDEFGQRKMKSKLADIEAGLTRVAQVAFSLMQQLYTQQKIFRVVQPNNSIDEYVINKRLVDDKTGEIQIVNDITVGKYDFVYVSGSTLPSNRYAELEFYMDAYQKGLIDRLEVLKKTEVFDMEGVLQRTDEITKLQEALKQAQGQIKKLQGDMQSRDREAVNLRKRVEVEKFKSDLDGVKNKSKAAGTIFEKRLDDNLSTIKRDIALATQNSLPSSGGKGSSEKKEV
ncbi:hypothetical protein CMI37_28180 [Candidatus Pacearchaeota archaeon]|nr:hypothetical protein [Candidatus Pacearchaeota archaeon]